MKDAFMASFFHEGVLGGALYLQSDKALYRTEKPTIEPKYRYLEIPYNGIERLETGLTLLLPTVTFIMKSGVSYKFAIFNRKKFLSRLNALRH
ncbi:hypothetical protein [Flavonifractor sp. HCP28S3_F3]|uniref:hypothetical protein n=1 Tax=Flavonifractor sp. HCP28S3_F3 TaxID=3438939 RepID=UPI003F8BAF50